MEVKPVVAVVTQKLADTLNEKPVANNKVMILQLKGVQKSLKKLQSFSEEKQVSDESRRSEDHLRVLYAVEDEIEIFTFKVSQQRKRFGFLMKHTFFFNNLNACRRLKQKIEKIQSRISSSHEGSITSSLDSSSPRTTREEEYQDDEDDVSHYHTHDLTQKSSSAVWPISEIPNTPSPKRGLTRSFSTIPNHQDKKLTFSYSYNEEEMNIVGFKQLSNFSYQEEEVGVFGLKDDIKSLVQQLTHQTTQNDMFVPIVGEVGSGKTTLARAVYRNRKIKDHFKFHDWIPVEEEHTSDRILPSVLNRVAAAKGKRYLIVLDGVQSCGVLKKLKENFPDENNGSKVIFTSRKIPEKKNINAHTMTQLNGEESRGIPEKNINAHIMKQLNREESWKMFLKQVGKEKEADQIKSSLISKILKICNGLPLNIVLMAGLLSTKRIKRWPSALHHDQCSDIVPTLCYNDLTIRSKLCLLYLALFPKYYDIPVRRLLRLWLAEGFVKRGNQRTREPLPEDLVQECFEDLVKRRMIQITKLRSDNSPRRCCLISVFHDFLLPKAKNIRLFYIHENLENLDSVAGPSDVRRMIRHVSTTSALDHQQSQLQRSTFDPSFLRSYISFNFQRRDMPDKEVGLLLGRIISSKFCLLRVLDLEGVCKPSLPEKLGHLCHLRYLGLRWTFLESLPESVGDLSYLETLDVKHTRVDSLPDSIWKLKQLRHLNLNNIRLSMPPRSSLTLLTLWGLVLDEKISVNEDLGKLLDLRELGIKFNLTKSQDLLLDWIAKLVNLQSLRLTSVNDMGRPSELVLKPLSTLIKLSHLNLYGKLEKLPALNEFPPTVKVLTLSISQLKEDPMETLEKLPCLIVLRLLGDSFIGKKVVCHRGGFQKLQVLKLWLLKELEDWDVEEGAMESLKELDIRRCQKLSNIPGRLLQKQRSLEELILTDMPKEFVAGIERRKSKDTTLTITTTKPNPLENLSPGQSSS
uniref:probable disease resistance protein RF9 n=1 Tax=Erigeron canadensis TaxID=72917 RepID=UPI001CB9BAB4|nr:probable disease resistance protein RF9 [Erigeron canadensis]